MLALTSLERPKMQDVLTQGEQDKVIRNTLVMAATEADISAGCLARIFRISERQVFTILSEAKKETQ